MINQSQSPFVRITLLLAAGVAVFLLSGKTLKWLVAVFVAVFAVYAFLVFTGSRILSYRKRWLYGLFIYILFLAAGYILAQKRMSGGHQTGGPAKAGAGLLVARVKGFPEEREKTFRITCALIAYQNDSAWNPFEEKALVYLQKDDNARVLGPGDLLLLRSLPEAVPPPLNPGEFDYRSYLERKGIRWQAYAGSGQWWRFSHKREKGLRTWAAESRIRLLDVLRSNGIEGKEFALASAILLGYDEYLDPGQRKQFAGAGAMHILCVSGLHVGIIAVVLNSILFFLRKKFIFRLLKLVLLIVLIWAYAAITGLSPSVMRAATMFSFLFAGKSFNRKASIYNTLAASAFFLLLFDPLMISSIGFQLSYMAVLGIIILYKPLHDLIIFNYMVPEKVWQLAIVSVAATAATFPLSVYYFHQFPNYFILTNFVVIPASFMILYAGMMLMAFSFIPALANLLAITLDVLLHGLGWFVEFIEMLPFSTTTNLVLPVPQLFLLFGLVAALGSLLVSRSGKYFLLSLVIAIALWITSAGRKYACMNQNTIACYNIRGDAALEFIHGRNSVFIGDSSLLQNGKSISYASSGNRMDRGVANTEFIEMEREEYNSPWFRKKGPMIWFAGKTLLVLDGKSSRAFLHSPPGVDYVFLKNVDPLTVERIAGNGDYWGTIINGSYDILDSLRISNQLERGNKYLDLTRGGFNLNIAR